MLTAIVSCSYTPSCPRRHGGASMSLAAPAVSLTPPTTSAWSVRLAERRDILPLARLLHDAFALPGRSPLDVINKCEDEFEMDFAEIPPAQLIDTAAECSAEQQLPRRYHQRATRHGFLRKTE